MYQWGFMKKSTLNVKNQVFLMEMIQISSIFVAECNNFSKKYLSNTAYTPKYQLLKKTPTLKNSLIVSIVQGFLLKKSNEKTQSENWKCSEAI